MEVEIKNLSHFSMARRAMSFVGKHTSTLLVYFSIFGSLLIWENFVILPQFSQAGVSTQEKKSPLNQFNSSKMSISWMVPSKSFNSPEILCFLYMGRFPHNKN